MLSSEARSREIYEAWHPHVESDAGAGAPWHELIARHVAPGDIVNRRVLEIGCGRGELVRRLTSTGAGPRHLIAADFAQSAVRLGRLRIGLYDGHRVVTFLSLSAVLTPAQWVGR